MDFSKDLSSKDLPFLERLRKEVEDNLNNDQFSVEELAKTIGMSRSQLHRKLNTSTGQSVSQFIREYRLQRGMELLKNSELTAAEVADRVGFGSATYFNKCFTEYYGFPPGETKNKIIETQITEAKGETEVKKPSGKSWVYFLVILGLVSVACGVYYYYYQNQIPERVGPFDKSIAILPFKNLSADRENEYFSEGVIEAIRTNLSQIGELRVISRTSVEQYRESTKSASMITSELGVSTLLEGSVQRDNNRVRIEVRLVDGASEGQLWSRRYDRELKDVFAIQSEIAQEIGNELNATLSLDERTKILKKDTESPEAYDLFLKGVYEYRTYTNHGIHRSIEYLTKAIELDSNYARPYAALANSYSALASIFGAEMTALEALEKGKPLFEEALAIDPGLSEALLVKGFYLLYHDWDFKGAENAYKMAIRTDHPDALAIYIDYLNFVGRHSEAMDWAEHLNIIDPYYPNSRIILSYVYNNRLEEALKFSETRLKLYTNYFTFDSHGFLLLNMKRYKEAIPYFSKAIALEGIRYPRMLGWIGAAYAKSGDRIKSLEIIEELKTRWEQKENGSIAFFIAVIYSAMNDKDNALSWLHVAFESHEMEMPWLLTEPQFYNLHSEPEFQHMAQSMGFPQTR